MKLKPLAVAVSVALPIAALASTVSVTTETVSSEYLEVFKGVQAPSSTLKLGAQYASGDVIRLNYSAAPRAGQTVTTAYSWPATLAIAAVTSAGSGTATTTATGSPGALAFFDSDDTSVSYRVTQAPAGGIGATGTGPSFGEVVVGGTGNELFFLAADIGAGNVTVTPSSETSQGVVFDSASKAGTLVQQLGSQFTYKVTGLSQTIDVESARKKFLSGTATTIAHVIGFSQVTNATFGTAAVAASKVATPGTIGVSLTGDFSWLDTSTTATGIQTTGSVTVGSGATLGGVSATQISLTLPAGGLTTALTFSNAATAVIPTQNLTASLSGVYSNGTTLAVGVSTASATGAYTLNGSSVTVYAVPTSKAVSNFIWLTNSGKTDGDVSIIVNDNGTAIDLGVVGVSKGGREFDVTAAMNDALEAAGKTLSGGRVHLDIITKVPAADVAVSAAYRVGDDRVNLLTSLETDND